MLSGPCHTEFNVIHCHCLCCVELDNIRHQAVRSQLNMRLNAFDYSPSKGGLLKLSGDPVLKFFTGPLQPLFLELFSN